MTSDATPTPNLRYRRAIVLASCTAVGLVFFVLADSVQLLGSIIQLIGHGQIGGGGADPDVRDLGLFIRSVSALIQIAIYVPTVVCFCLWFYRGAVNARALGAGGFRIPPALAVGWFFIPIAHLWMPFKAASEIWRASAIDATDGASDAWTKKGPPPLVSLWWGAWISGTLLGNLGSSLARRQPGLDVIGSWILPFGTVLQIIAAVLCIAVVFRLTGHQEDRSRAVTSGHAPETPPGSSAANTTNSD